MIKETKDKFDEVMNKEMSRKSFIKLGAGALLSSIFLPSVLADMYYRDNTGTTKKVLSSNLVLFDDTNYAMAVNAATLQGTLLFESKVGGTGVGSINFRPAAKGQVLFDGQTYPADPSDFAVSNRESHKMYYGTGGATGTIPVNMALTNNYAYTELYCQAYSGTQTSMSLWGQYNSNIWRSSVSFTTGKSGSGVNLYGMYHTTTFNADVTFTHNNVGKTMNTQVIGAQFDAGATGTNLTQTAGALNLNLTGVYGKINASGTGTISGSPTITAIAVKGTNNGYGSTGGTPTKNYYTFYGDAISGTSAWGLYLGATTGASGGTAYGIQIGAVTGGTTNWALASDGGDSYHVGNLRVGGNTAPTTALDATGTINASVGYSCGGTAAVGDATYAVYNDGVTSGQVTSITTKGGIITAIAVVP